MSIAHTFIDKARHMSAALRGSDGILDTLRDDHAELLELLEVGDRFPLPDEVRQRYPMLRTRLLSHLVAEQRVLYAACEEDSLIAPWMDEAQSDHDTIERLLLELDDLPREGEAWAETFTLLSEHVTEHIHQEEQDLFRLCDAAFAKSTLSELADDYRDIRREVERRMAGASEPGIEVLTMPA